MIIQPYQFEPRVRADVNVNVNNREQGSSDSDDDGMRPAQRLRDLTWCTCARCVLMPTIRECICCKEMNSLQWKLESIKCIGEHPEFRIVCLHPAVLRTALIMRSQLKAESLVEPFHNK